MYDFYVAFVTWFGIGRRLYYTYTR